MRVIEKHGSSRVIYREGNDSYGRFILIPAVFLCSLLFAAPVTKNSVMSLTKMENPGSDLQSQITDSGSHISRYSFLNRNEMVLDNDQETLYRFYRKLDSLREGKKSTVTVVQIGDSHLETGQLPGMVRRRLQTIFGNAGRGLIYPYRIAEGYDPLDMRIMSSGEWSYADIRNTKTRILFGGSSGKELSPGLCGYCLRLESPKAELTITPRTNENGESSFNRVTLISGEDFPLPEYRVVHSDDSREAPVMCQEVRLDKFTYSDSALNSSQEHRMITELEKDADGLKTQGAESSGIPPYRLLEAEWNNPVSSVKLDIRKSRMGESGASLYGIILANENSGLFYHAIPVNGSFFDQFNKHLLFFRQLPALHPDLVIVSLGTNDSMIDFRAENFYYQFRRFIQTIRHYVPGADILVTVPPDGFKSRNPGRKQKSENTDLQYVRRFILGQARAWDYAVWDLYKVMGGAESMQSWHEMKLSQNDMIHFTGEGYTLQGEMLSYALLKGYQAHVASNNP